MRLALAIVALFILAANINAQETLQPYAPPILHTFLDSSNVYPESVTIDLKSREIVPVNMPAETLNTPDGLFLEGNTSLVVVQI